MFLLLNPCFPPPLPHSPPPPLAPSPSLRTLDELTQGSVAPVTQACVQGAGPGSALPGHLSTVEVCTVVTAQVAKAGQVLLTEAGAKALQEHQRLLMVQQAQDGHLLLLGQVGLTLLLAAHGQATGSHSPQHSAHGLGLLGPRGVVVQGPWHSLCCFHLAQGSGWDRRPVQLSPVPRTGLCAVWGEGRFVNPAMGVGKREWVEGTGCSIPH